MGSKYKYIKFRVSRRSEWLLAVQHAENNGFTVHPRHLWKLDAYQGGRGIVSVVLSEDVCGLNRTSWDERHPEGTLIVDTLERFKHAVNCFCHDGYLDVNNLKVV